MATQRAQWQARALSLAQECAQLGGRARTIHLLTGMPLPEIQRLFFVDPSSAPRGRAPDSPEWYHAANLLNRTQASIFCAIYMRLRKAGIAAEDALVGSYRNYLTACPPPHRISFDRAFDLAAHTDGGHGRWFSKRPAFCVVTCKHCASEYLTNVGVQSTTAQDCPFCKLLQRYECDPRLQRSFPQPSPWLDRDALCLHLHVVLNAIGNANLQSPLGDTTTAKDSTLDKQRL